MRKNYKLWGPSAHTCIKLMDENHVASHQEKVISAANHFTKMFGQEEEVNAAMASHEIFVVRPTDRSRQERTVEFASSHVLGFVSRAYANQGHLMLRVPTKLSVKRLPPLVVWRNSGLHLQDFRPPLAPPRPKRFSSLLSRSQQTSFARNSSV